MPGPNYYDTETARDLARQQGLEGQWLSGLLKGSAYDLWEGLTCHYGINLDNSLLVGVCTETIELDLDLRPGVIREKLMRLFDKGELRNHKQHGCTYIVDAI